MCYDLRQSQCEEGIGGGPAGGGTMRLMAWLFIVLFAGGPTMAQVGEEAPWRGPADAQQMVGELQRLVDQAERDRAADPRLLQRLRALAARYDWPWSRRLLGDRFEDGDYTRNPTWTVTSGRFWVDWNLGLRSEVARPAARATARAPEQTQQQSQQQSQRQPDLGSQILGAVLQQILQPEGSTTQQGGTTQGGATARREAAPEPERAELSIARVITPSFDVRVEFSSVTSPGRLEFGPYIGASGQEGYRLAYVPGGRPNIAVLRYSRWGSSIIEGYDHPRALEDERSHYLQWLRLANGEMAVFLDGKEVIRTTDRTYREPFAGFAISNLGGEFAINQVEVLGTP